MILGFSSYAEDGISDAGGQRNGVVSNFHNASATNQDAPRAVQPGSPQRIAETTAAAIKRLGLEASDSQISALVFSAVRSAPEAVLDIVYATVQSAPRGTADAIVGAAVSAVPNPWKTVLYRSRPAKATVHKLERDFKGEPDFKGGPEGKEIIAPERSSNRDATRGDASTANGTADRGANGANNSDGTAMTLAEAIVLTAIDAGPGMDGGELFTAAEAALRGDPSYLIAAINHPRAISGVGDVGVNNYANEPRRPDSASLLPDVPPVSR